MESTFTFLDVPRARDARHDYSPFRGTATPIVIDNGAGKCRAGWASEKDPRLVFDNLVAKPRFKKEETVSTYLAGSDISYDHLVRWALRCAAEFCPRSHLRRSPHDNGIVTQWDAQEQILDHAFERLGIDTDGAVHHPIAMTECVCNPNFSRSKMSELLFECYGVPRIAYGIDSLFSLYQNDKAVSLI